MFSILFVGLVFLPQCNENQILLSNITFQSTTVSLTEMVNFVLVSLSQIPRIYKFFLVTSLNKVNTFYEVFKINIILERHT